MKIVSFNGQYRVTIPKDIVEARGWDKTTKIRFLEDSKGDFFLKPGNLGLSIISYNKQFRLTIPKDIIDSKGWKKGVKVRFVETYSGDLILKVIGGGGQ